MRCYICNCNIEEPEFDVDHKALPCPECNNVILDSLMDEDDLDLLDFDDTEEEGIDEDQEQPEDSLP